MAAKFRGNYNGKTGLYTLIVVIGGAVYRYVGPNWNQLVAYVKAVLGIE
jgi:hypothetical protein